MAEYIKTTDAITTTWMILRGMGYAAEDNPDMVKTVAAVFNTAPAADVAEVRYCRFSLEGVRRRESVYKCSACGNYLTVRADTLNGGRGDMNYCPFCGGKVKHGWQDE